MSEPTKTTTYVRQNHALNCWELEKTDEAGRTISVEYFPSKHDAIERVRNTNG